MRPGPGEGVSAVEFAIVALLFFTLLLGIMEFGRWLFVLNGANEATRLGARLAVVCSIEDADDLTGIRARMSDMTGGGVPADRMVLDYAPAGCTVDNCRTVTARIVGAQLTPHIPFFGIPFPVIPESTEIMNIIIPEMLQNALTETMSVEDAANDAASKIEEVISGL